MFKTINKLSRVFYKVSELIIWCKMFVFYAQQQIC